MVISVRCYVRLKPYCHFIYISTTRQMPMIAWEQLLGSYRHCMEYLLAITSGDPLCMTTWLYLQIGDVFKFVRVL